MHDTTAKPTSPGTPTVDVAIVNWNTPEAACTAAKGFLASSDAIAKVTVIDNDSTPGAQEILEELLPDQAHLVLSKTNLGFGAGANRALREGKGEFVCISNADVEPERDALAALASFCTSHPDCGMVGPSYPGRGEYHARLPSALALTLRPLVGGFRHRSVPSPRLGQSIEVEQPAGACFLLRRAVWEEMGGFDEDYFLWYEDVDLARRLQASGRRNYVCGDAIVHHEEGLATESMAEADHQKARLTGLRLYLDKHHPRAHSISTPVFAVARRLRTRDRQSEDR